MRAADQLLVLFDGDCGFCGGAVDLLARLDRHHRLRMVPFQQPGLPASVGLTRAQCEASVWAVRPDGRRYAGAAAAALALDCALGLPLLLALVSAPGARHLADLAYGWVARHRGSLPGATPYCQRPGARCAPARRRWPFRRHLPA